MKVSMALRAGDLIQLSPGATKRKEFAGCIMTVTEPKPWGAVGYVQALGENGEMGGRAFYRAEWPEFEMVGHAEWWLA